ncbi:hypothetical protein CDL15_Pgr027395 [Punica granatum]|uniref:Uncharacterized protein n=1 Tax=Punica granatum TaxID=22663 RepID=A0A218Y1F7_PUNGR|nr:hypothetical protein CDL15_Pgr027395 [Punica granatum]
MVGEDEVGRRRGVRRPWTAVPASRFRSDSAGDGDEHRLGYAVLGRGVTRLGSVGIEGNFRVFGEVFEFSSDGFSKFNCRKSGELRGGNRWVLLRGVSRVRSRGEIGAEVRDFQREWEIRTSGVERESKSGTMRER